MMKLPSQGIMAWLRRRTLTDEEYIERIRRGRRHAKKVQIVTLCGFGVMVITLLSMLKRSCFLRPNSGSATDSLNLFVGFWIGVFFGTVLYAMLASLFVVMRVHFGDRRDELIVKFYDELKKRDA